MRNIFNLILSCLLMTNILQAQGNDDASTYTDWNNGSSGGTGFSNWSINAPADSNYGGTFIGSSDIDVLGKSWVIYANTGNTVDAIRSINTPPASGDRISIKMDNSDIDNGGSVGISIRNASDENLLEFYFNGGDMYYTINDNAGANSTGVSFTDEGLLIEIEITSATTYDLKITDEASSNVTTLIGRSLKSPTGGQIINKIRLFNYQAGAGPSHNLYFNDLSHEVGVLPIELASFEATKRTDAVELNWTTLSEENNEGFYIERSTNQTDFEQIHFEKGNGNTIEQVDYSFTDERPLDGVNYYRLKQIDFDGAFEYSDIVSVDFKGQTTIKLFPNPSTDKLTITGDISELVTLKIIDLNGKVLYQSEQFFAEQADIDLDAIPSGSYILQIISTNKQSTLSTMSFVKR